MVDAVCKLGFKAEDVKTIRYNVDSTTRSIKDKFGNYEYVFDGYECENRISIVFDMNMALLSNLISSISKCLIEPDIDINFEIKNESEHTATLLARAAEDARIKAEAIAAGSGVKLGNLIKIDSKYERDNYVRARCCVGKISDEVEDYEMDITPDDIDLIDLIEFVWEIA